MPPRSKTTARKRPAPKRGATGKAAGQRGGKSASASAGRGNLILGFVAGALVGGLAMALWYETSKPQLLADSSEPTAEPVAAAASSKPPASDNTPKAGDAFYHQLPSAEVKTFSENKTDAPLDNYVLQSGAFRTRSEADAMEAQIILETGLDAWIDERVSSSGTLWYRVRLGPYEGKRATDKIKRQLWERARIEAVRYQYNPEP